MAEQKGARVQKEDANMDKTGIIGKIILAIGLTLAGFFPGYYYYMAKFNNNTVTVKGLSEMDVKADLAVWDLKYVVASDNLQTAQQQIQEQGALIIKFLKEYGLSENEIIFGRTETNDLLTNPYRGSSDVSSSRFIVSQNISVTSPYVDLIEKALSGTSDLVAQGIVFDSQGFGSPVSYVFTGINDIKPKMLEQSIQNAKEAALEFAKSSGSKLGKIKDANQGMFSILPQVQTVNAQESGQINKKVRVVSTVQFWLE